MTSGSVMSLSSLRPMCWFGVFLLVVPALTQVCNEDGAVRLVGGTVYQGRLEVCANGYWGTVCNDGFDINAARVVCLQLGIQENASTGVIFNIFFGGGRHFQPIHLDELQCSGSEETLLNCTHSGIGVHDCDHREDVGIICQRSLDCTDGDVRLVDVDGDSFNVTEGRVEYCVGGLWGTVCNHLWGNADAAVVCRQLGLNTLDPRVLIEDVPNVNDLLTPIVLDGLSCRGTEARLGDCRHELVVEYCSHSDDAGAICNRGVKDKCLEENTLNNVSIVEGNIINLTAGSIGTCQLYLNKSSVCNSFFESSDYVFTKLNQSFVSSELDGRILPVLSEECGDLMSRVLCHYFFAPCGANGSLHLPLSLCSEECHYVKSICANEWGIVNNLLSSAGLSTVNCNNTDDRLQGLVPCCIDAGIEIEVFAAADVPIAVIITVPTILLVLMVIATSIIVIIVIKIRKKEVENYYSEVGLPPLPMRNERNTSHQQGLQTFQVLNVGNHGQDFAIALVDEKKKQATTTSENPAYGANELSVTTTENTAYQANELDVTLTENTAYGATDVVVTTSENPAYGATDVVVTTSENPAYGATDVVVTTSENPAYGATDVAVTTPENPAYITNFTDLSNGKDTET